MTDLSSILSSIGFGSSSDDKTEEQQKKSSDESLQQKNRVNQQAYLMFNQEQITKESSDNAKRFKYFAQVIHDYPAELNNILFKKPINYDILLNSKSSQLSYFIPKIRIFKEYPISISEVVNVELPISQPYQSDNFDSIFTNKEGRGGGVGLKSFKWNTIGTGLGNQFSFGAELELFFESIGEISKVRSIDTIANKSISTSFEDLLIVKQAPDRNTNTAVYEPDYYRIKAEIGWHMPQSNQDLVPREMIEEFESSNLILHMTLHSHEIKIADDSTVTLTLKYIAYIEALTDSPKNSNIFYPADKNFQADITQRREEIQQNSEQINGNVDSGVPPVDGQQKQNLQQSNEDKQKEIQNLENQNKLKIYKRLLSYLYDKDFIKYVFTDEQSFQKFTSLLSTPKDKLSSSEQISQFNSEMDSLKAKNSAVSSIGTVPSGPQVTSTDPQQMTSEFTNATKIYNKSTIDSINENIGNASDKIVIPFFYFGDLLEAILEGMYNGGPDIKTFFEKEMKVLLGPIIFYDYGRLTDKISLRAGSEINILPDGTTSQGRVYTGSKTVINIADIPISLDVYTAWFTKKIVDAGVTNMSLRDFINNIINDLVIRAVGVETYSFAPRQKTRLIYKTKVIRREPDKFFIDTESINAPSFGSAVSNGQTFVPGVLKFPASSLKLYNFNTVSEQKSVNDNFMLIYSVSDQQFELRSDYETDKRRGIRHIVYGAETGLIKIINFARQDNPLIRSHNMRMASQQNADKSIILREVYNANVEMYGNCMFEIGELLYISPSLFGSSTSLTFVKNLGIGGYFMISKIENIIEDGVFNTKLDLIWNAKGDGIPLSLNDGLTSATNNVKLV